jgi:hypothetical protein
VSCANRRLDLIDLDLFSSASQNPALDITALFVTRIQTQTMDSQFQRFDAPLLAAESNGNARVGRLVWGFVALGTIIRLVGYLLRFPLWVDECMLAENFLDRTYLELLSPLDNQQVAPIGFLWIELACVRAFGFSEWSLRLFPLLCGIGSLFVFRHLASRLLTGVPLVLAVGCLAVAKAPLGLGANAKPYACDLLVAAALLALAVEWLRTPDRTVWLWSLVAALPVAFALSFPAVFVSGAISLGLLRPVWRAGQWRIWHAFGAYHVSLAVALTCLHWTCTQADSPDTQMLMLDYWTQQDGFPPWEAWSFMRWLAVSHFGDKIFAVPYGAENGGGIVGLVLCITASIIMYRGEQRPILTMFLATFGLTFLAAALRIYPYGGHNRLTQFLVPSLAISLGMAAAALLALIRNPNIRRRLAYMLVGGLALFGTGLCIRDVIRPYHFVHDEHHREFARRFWLDEPGTTTVCALTDLGQKFCNMGWYGCYRCNQQIHSAQHRLCRALPEQDIFRLRQPIRLVVFRPPYRMLDRQAVAECLDRFEPYFELAGHESYVPCLSDIGLDKFGGYEVYRFKPRDQTVLGGPAVLNDVWLAR